MTLPVRDSAVERESEFRLGNFHPQNPDLHCRIHPTKRIHNSCYYHDCPCSITNKLAVRAMKSGNKKSYCRSAGGKTTGYSGAFQIAWKNPRNGKQLVCLTGI